MNGQELFEQLSRMTEQERMTSQFWKLADNDDFDECVREVAGDLMAGSDQPEKMKKALNDIGRNIRVEEVAEIASRTQSIESECEDSYMDGFRDTYREQVEKWLRVRLIAYGIVTQTREELEQSERDYEESMRGDEEWRRHKALGN